MRLIYLLALLALASIQSTNAQFDFPDCYPGQTQFNSTIVTSDYATGYPLVCVNGTFAPICNGVPVGYLGTLILCSQFNTTSGYVGTPSNVTLAPLKKNDISYTVTDLNCDYLVGCSNPIFSRDDCTNGYLSFTCPSSICDGPEVSLYNNETTYINGTEVVTGVLGICLNGGLIGFCDEGSIFDGAAQLFCNGLGYLNGEKAASNSRLPLGANYLTNFTCISTPYGPSNCTEGTLATNPACYNGSLDYTIRCSVRRASCDGNGVILNYNTTSIVNGTEYITGVPTQCNDGYIDALCNDGTITQDTMDFLCQSLGYSRGQLLMVNSTQYGTLPQGTAYYTNFTCPPNALSVDNCGAVLVECPSAGSSMEYVLQCSRPYSVCEEGAIRFINGTSGSYDSYDTRYETLSGSLQICVNGKYRYVCGLSNASFSASDIVATACIQLGYVNSSSNYTNEYFYQSSNPVIESISCPYNGSHFSLCSINTTTDSNSCYNYDRVLGGTCNRITPACTGLFQMADRGTFSYANNTYIRTGRIEACVNNVYYPVCANGLNNTLSSPPPTNYQLDGVCNDVFYREYTYLPDQYIGSRSDYYNSTGSTRVISSISCPNGAYRATECNVTFSDNGCSSYGNDAVISCINRAEESIECSGNTITLANYTSYRSPYGSSYSIGRVVACINGSFVTVCNNTAYPEYFAGQACNDAVSYSNYTIIPFDPMYLNGDYNLIVNNCSNTPQYYYDYSYCDNTVTNGTCSNGTPLTVRCEAECSSDGQVRLTDTDTVYYNNGTSGTTGNVEYCYNGRWSGLCQNNLNDFHARVFCGAFGYNNGSFILSNSSKFTSYVNLSCPDYYFYSPSSCYILNSFSMCNETSINALLYCYDASPDYCYYNRVRFSRTNSGSSYSSGQYPNVTTYSVGNVEICVNNTYYDVCADQLTPEQALLICSYVSYDSNRAYTSAVIGPADEVYSYDASANSISNFTCPYGYLGSSCSFDIVYNSGCTNNGGLAVITCIRDAPTRTCETSSLHLQDKGTGYFNNDTSFSIGRPSICYNNSYIPYCTSFDMNTARAFCGISDNAFSARSYPIFGSTDDYGYNDQSSLIVSNLTCPVVDSSNYYYIYGSCYNSTSTSDNGGCSGISDEAIISCINSPVPCNLQTNFRYIDYYSTGDSYTDIYQVGVCINATYGDVCSDGITDNVALLFCHSRGSYYNRASVSYNYTDKTYSYYDNGYAGFNCPYYANSISSCYSDVSVVNDCSMGYGGILVIECTAVYTPTGPTSECYYDGQVIFNNTEYSTNNNSLYSISGYVSVCVNGTPALVCGDASIGQTELTSICAHAASLAYGYVGTPPGVTLAPLNVSDNTAVVNNFYCDPQTFSCTSTPGSNCSSEYLTVTCPQLCNGPSLQLYNNISYTSNGIEYVTGIFILCSDFVIIALCNDSSIYDDPASLLCNSMGYENGISINSNQASYGTLPEGTQYFNNFTCPPDAEHFDNCTASYTTNPNCARSSYNYVVQCSRQAQIFGTVDVTAVAQSIEEGNTLTLTCSLMTNSPEALPFSWFRGSSLITPSGRVTISTSNPTANNSTGLYTITSQLMIQNTLTGDSGQYLCRVAPSLSDNIAITIRARNECIINDGSTPCVNGYCIDEVDDYYCVCPDNFIGKNCETPVSSNSAPVIVTPPMDQDVPLGSLVNLTCVATGAPQPVITWYYEGALITGANSPIYIIDSIQPPQRGTYSCIVMNSEGIDQATATVTINDIRQYYTTVTASSGQAQSPLALQATYNQTRDALVGNELSPGSGIIVADITYSLVPSVLGIQFIFTLRVPPMANTNRVTNSLNGVTANIAANNPGISFTPVMRFDGCSPETVPVTAGSSLSIMWPEVGIGVVARPNCPCGNLTTNFGAVAMRRCNGTFSAPGVWLAPNTTQCIFDQTTTTLCQLSMNNNSLDVASQLNTITTNTEEIDPVDIGVIGTLAEDLAEDASDPQVLGPLMDMMDNILDVPSSVFMESQQSSNGSQRFINTVETIASTLTITSGNSATVIRSKLAVRAQMVDSSSFSGTQLSVSTTSTGTLNNNSLSSSTNANSDASISLPSTLLTTANVTGPVRLGFSVIANGKLFQDTGVTVSTIVMSVDVYNNGGSRVPVEGLSDPVMVSFTVTSSNSMSECAFWDSTSFTWSTTGVTTVRTTTGVTCMATHLSSFAVVQGAPVSSSTTPTPTPTSVTAPTEPVTEEYSPEPILFVGLIISILLILVAVIAHLASDAQRHCPEGRLLATSHITLIILYFVFVLATAATYTDSTGFCGTFAGFFHYFSLVYFVWLMFEGLFYAVKLCMGIGGNVFTRHYFIVSLIFALILPAVIVIVSAALGYDYYAMENVFCRPQKYLFYYGYVIPVAVLYLLTFISYCASFFLIYCSGMTSVEKRFRKDSVISHYYAGLILFIIFGVVWVFAITGTQYNITGPGSTALQYVFGFFSMIHALLLIILTFARTSDTRLAFGPVLRMILGRTGKYEFAADSRGTQEAHGLDISENYSTDETKMAKDDEKEPLAVTNVDEDDDLAMSPQHQLL